METELVEARLQHSRAQIRAMLLLPDPATGELEEDVFPRSKVMRAAMSFAVNPRRRRLAGTVLSTLGVMAGRWGMARGGIWPQLATLFGATRH